MGSLNGVFDACTYLAVTLYFWRVSKNWFYFALVGYLFNVVSAVGAWFLPESPRYLCERGETYELERSLKAIAKVNRRQLNFNPDHFTTNKRREEEEEGKDSKTIGFYLRQRAILVNLGIMALVWLIVSFSYYLITFLTNTFDQVYTTAISSGVSEVAGIVTGGALYSRLGPRASLSISFGVAFLGAFSLLFYGVAH